MNSCLMNYVLFAPRERKRRAGGGGVTWVNFCWVCTAGLSEPLPHYSLWCGQLQTPLRLLLGKCVIFPIPTQSLSIYVFTYSTNILVHLLTIKYEELSYPKNQKMCDPILVTLLKMRPHYSQSSRENVAPSSGTSQLASYKGVPPPARGRRDPGKLEARSVPYSYGCLQVLQTCWYFNTLIA